MTIIRLVKMAIAAALYVALTFAFYFMSFGSIQFRIAEILVLLVFYKKDYIIPLVLGTLIANIFSPLGPIDMAVGSLGTLVGVMGIYFVSLFKNRFKHKWLLLFLASLMPVISNAILVGWELNYVFGDPFWIMAMWVAIGEFTVVSVFGVGVFTILEKNKSFMELLISD